MTRDRTRVAVIGASGIGKHHAKWWAVEGAEVCAFAGSSPESVASTQEMLQNLFGFDGTGYSDVDDLLRAERPDIVDVCTPPRLHSAHVEAALNAGCDVLCEKPFVYDAGVADEELMVQARGLAEKAARAGLRLGLCSQYHAAVRCCREILADQTGDGYVRTFRGHVESPVRGRPPDPRGTWFDLAPHMLAAAQALVPGAEMPPDSVRTFFSGYQASARFRLERNAAPLECHVVTARTLGEAETGNVREFELDEARFRIEAGTDADGLYCARLQTPWGVFQRPDMLRLTVREFLAGQVALDGPAAAANLSWMLRIARAAP